MKTRPSDVACFCFCLGLPFFCGFFFSIYLPHLNVAAWEKQTCYVSSKEISHRVSEDIDTVELTMYYYINGNLHVGFTCGAPNRETTFGWGVPSDRKHSIPTWDCFPCDDLQSCYDRYVVTPRKAFATPAAMPYPCWYNPDDYAKVVMDLDVYYPTGHFLVLVIVPGGLMCGLSLLFLGCKCFCTICSCKIGVFEDLFSESDDEEIATEPSRGNSRRTSFSSTLDGVIRNFPGVRLVPQQLERVSATLFRRVEAPEVISKRRTSKDETPPLPIVMEIYDDEVRGSPDNDTALTAPTILVESGPGPDQAGQVVGAAVLAGNHSDRYSEPNNSDRGGGGENGISGAGRSDSVDENNATTITTTTIGSPLDEQDVAVEVVDSPASVMASDNNSGGGSGGNGSGVAEGGDAQDSTPLGAPAVVQIDVSGGGAAAADFNEGDDDTQDDGQARPGLLARRLPTVQSPTIVAPRLALLPGHGDASPSPTRASTRLSTTSSPVAGDSASAPASARARASPGDASYASSPECDSLRAHRLGPADSPAAVASTLRRCFAKYDSEGNGFVRVASLRSLLKRAGFDYSPAALKAALQNLDPHGFAVVLWEDFLKWASATLERRPSLSSEELTCQICMDARRQTVFLECGHAVACRACARKLVGLRPPLCPLCRSEVVDVVEIVEESPSATRVKVRAVR